MSIKDMTLRDYFAAKSAEGLLAQLASDKRADDATENADALGLSLPQAVARAAYIMADAMLAEREKKQ